MKIILGISKSSEVSEVKIKGVTKSEVKKVILIRLRENFAKSFIKVIKSEVYVLFFSMAIETNYILA